jgi:hypothetical protein
MSEILIYNSCEKNIFLLDSDDTLSSSTINSTKTTSSSSIEQTLPMTPTKISTVAHRFVSRKIFKPETCFVVRILYL